MSIDELTKKEFDETFKDMISETSLLVKDYMDVYTQLLDFRSQYRKDFASHRIMHYIEDNILKYKKLESRKVGFTYGKK